MNKTLFVLGKGGAGKSTVASLLALDLARQGRGVTLASLDDAHNLGDIFEVDCGAGPVAVGPNLSLVQVDRDREVKAFLAGQTQKIRQSHTYLSAFNLDHHFDVLKYSPGMEAHGLVEAFQRLKKEARDILIVDLPPTALALHFFTLPALSLVWLEQLEKLRAQIKEKKEMISRIKFPGKTVEQDKILNRIRELSRGHGELADFFRDRGQCTLVGVTNGDTLSRAETRRIMDALAAMDIPLGLQVLNHRQEGAGLFPQEAGPSPDLVLPPSPWPLVGLSSLEKFLDTHLPFRGLDI